MDELDYESGINGVPSLRHPRHRRRADRI